MIDIEKVVKGLEHCRLMTSNITFNPCYECPYKGNYSCADILKTDALELLKKQSDLYKALAQSNAVNEYLNKEFESRSQIVQCKDCVNRRVCVIAKKHDGFTDNKFDPDWFCADGEHK